MVNRGAEARKTSLVNGKQPMVCPVTCEVEYAEDDVEFMKAMDRYKRERRRPYPTWKEVLAVLHSLGYRKVEPPGPLTRGG